MHTWAQYRAAAASVRAAEFGVQAMADVRPRGVLGIVRSRGPLALMLAVADREDRLVWPSADGFAVLEAPSGRRRAVAAGPATSVLRLVDRHWELLVMAGPPIVFLAAAVPAAVLTRQPLAGIVLVLAALVYVSLLLVAGLVTAVGWLVRTFGHRTVPTENLADEARAGTTWMLVLCHAADRRRGPDLLRAASRRVVRLVTHDVEAMAATHGARTTRVVVLEELSCRYRAVTTSYMRSLVEATARDRPYREGDDVVVLRSGGATAEIDARQVASGGFLFWYASGIVIAVLICAVFVADAERSACLDACAGRPASYGEALKFLAQRMLWSDPAGLHPATDRAFLLGWLFSLLTPMLIFVAIVAVRQYQLVVAAATERRRARERRVRMRSRLVILVATAGERNAVVHAVTRATGVAAQPKPLHHHTVFELGTLSEVDVFLAQTEQGSIGVGGSALAAASLIDQLEPTYLVMVGICFGLQGQPMGDVIVARQLKVMDHVKVVDTEPPGAVIEISRGDKPSCSLELLDRFRAAEYDWTGATVEFGLMLSASRLVDSEAERQRLLAAEPEALGGEMEGAGLYAAAAKESVPWIVIKAVSDHGVGKSDEAQALAARYAADFVTHAIRTGLLDPVTARP